MYDQVRFYMIPVTENSYLWQLIRPRWSFCKRHLFWPLNFINALARSLAHFRCDVCVKPTCFPRAELARKARSCCYCASSLHAPSVICALSMELSGESPATSDFPYRLDLLRVGLSNGVGFAEPLAIMLGYMNIFHHTSSLQDILNVDPAQFGCYGFLISPAP